jgi:molybdopterin-biosynthesis enzyme MoeA-like protein
VTLLFQSVIPLLPNVTHIEVRPHCTDSYIPKEAKRFWRGQISFLLDDAINVITFTENEVKAGKIPESRIDESVKRIIKKKLQINK